GFSRKDDTLPERVLKEPLKKGPAKGYVVKLKPMLDEYYGIRGWDIKTGIPTRKKLEELGLKDVAEELEKYGKLPE
ncbi:aldehyde ferredoxin oxidoreductase, partial [Candidatus Bathyarchaeota archaeon]|nr:aldehyde ferredoxin oxidoreductase [Candidatus Bathyarchaeota archaeon]